MLLHIMSSGLNQQQVLQRCLALTAAGDAVLFIEDGVYWATKAVQATTTLETASKGTQFYVLKEDLKARGIEEHIGPEAVQIDYLGFVKLTEKYERSVSWY